MTKPFSPAEQLKAKQLADSIAAKLPITLAFDDIEAEFLVLLLRRSATAPVVPVVEKAE